MSYFLPYLAYTWAATGIAPEEDWTGTRPAGRESRTRLFTLVRYKTPDGYLQTTFGRFIHTVDRSQEAGGDLPHSSTTRATSRVKI